MNGLETIELMKKGKLVAKTDDTGDVIYIYKILNNNVCFKRIEDSDNKYQIDFAFDFSATYEEYIEPKPLTGWEHSCYKGSYFYIGPNGVSCDTDIYNSLDKKRIDDANYFSTKEKAEEINFKQTLFRKLQRFSDENGGNEIDWNKGEQRKWMIRFDHGAKRLYVVLNTDIQNFGQVYFVSKKITEQAIELFHDELIKYFTM